MVTLLLWGEKQYINRAQSSAGWALLNEEAGWFMSAVVLDLTSPFLSLGYLKKTAVCLRHQYSEVLLDCGTKEAEKITPPLRRWDKVLWFKHAMVPCYIFPGCGRCPKSASSVTKKILELLKSSTSASFNLFPPRILVYFSKLLNCKLWHCNTHPGSRV